MEFFSDDSIELSGVYAFFFVSYLILNRGESFRTSRNKRPRIKKDCGVSSREDAHISPPVSSFVVSVPIRWSVHLASCRSGLSIP